MWKIFIVIEIVNVILAVRRWTVQYMSDKYKYQGSMDSDTAFACHLLAGLFPIIALGFALGEMSYNHSLRISARKKELEDVVKDVNRLLE